MITGVELIGDIDRCEPRENELAIWWLGQHSFVVKAAGRIIYLDPFLSPLAGRRVPPLLEPGQVRHADVICGSHDHADHIDRPAWPTLAAASPRAKFVVPNLLRVNLAGALGLGLDRLIGMNDGQTVPVNGVRISAVAAAHERLEPDPATGEHPCLGYVIEMGGWTIYHAGDTCLYEGMLKKLRRWRHDILFLPINGRDAKRYAAGIIGNLTGQEAADLAGALAPRWVIPAHYEMFTGNTADPREFVARCRAKYPALRTLVCTHGRRLILRK